jgi:hypothetical protein
MTLLRPYSLVVITSFVALGACGGEKSAFPVGGCAAPFTPSVRVITLDSITGAPLAGSASGTLTKPGFSDTLQHGWAATDTMMWGGLDSGTFQVSITHLGYRTWSRSGIVVTPTGVCSEVNTANLRALLQPAP